jgi:hypothetical protein
MNKRKNTNDHTRQSLHNTSRYLILGPGENQTIDGVYRESNHGKGLGDFCLGSSFWSGACICTEGCVIGLYGKGMEGYSKEKNG